MRSFMIGLVVALSLTTATTAFAGNVLLWEQEPTEALQVENLLLLQDHDFTIFGGIELTKFEPILVDESRGIYATLGQENLGIVLADYIVSKNKFVEKVDASFSPELKCEDEKGNLIVDCDNLDFIELGDNFASL